MRVHSRPKQRLDYYLALKVISSRRGRLTVDQSGRRSRSSAKDPNCDARRSASQRAKSRHSASRILTIPSSYRACSITRRDLARQVIYRRQNQTIIALVSRYHSKMRRGIHTSQVRRGSRRHSAAPQCTASIELDQSRRSRPRILDDAGSGMSISRNVHLI
jgi:hypothetical protein